MKKIILSWGGTLLFLLSFISQETQAQCSGSGPCFDIIYSYKASSDGTQVTLSFIVKGKSTGGPVCKALSYIAFQLPAGVIAGNPSVSGGNFQYGSPENPTSDTNGNPGFRSLKFESKGEGIKLTGEQSTFTYTLTKAQFEALNSQFASAGGFRVEIKGGQDKYTYQFKEATQPTLSFNVSGPNEVCNSTTGYPYTFFVSPVQQGVTYTFSVPEGEFIIDPNFNQNGQIRVGIVIDEDEVQPNEFRTITVTARGQCGEVVATKNVKINICDNPGTPLPVTLTRFGGVFSSAGVTLNWETATEINNERFEVERSANGIDFLKVGEVQGNGNSSVVLKYSFTDKQPLAGTLYYRLKQVDYDGAYEYSKVVSVESRIGNAGSFKLNLFPNPTQGGAVSARIEGVPIGSSEMVLQVVDMSGKVLHTSAVNTSSSEFDMELQSLGLRQGVYLVTLSTSGQSARQRLVIQ